MECILRRQRSNTIHRYTLPAQKSTYTYILLVWGYGIEGCCEEGEPSGGSFKGMGVGEGRRAPVIEGRAKGSYMYHSWHCLGKKLQCGEQVS